MVVRSPASLVALLVVAAAGCAPTEAPRSQSDDGAPESAPSVALMPTPPAPSVSSSATAAPLPAAAMCAGLSTYPAAAVHQGNIHYCARAEVALQLTEGGKDDAPSLSPDGKRVVFVRDAGRKSYDDGGLEVVIADNRILVVDVGGGAAREVAKNGACLSLWQPVFASDRVVLVTARGYEVPRYTHSSVCSVEVDAPKPVLRSVASGTDCVSVIPAGRFAGKLYATGYEGSPPSEYARIVDLQGSKLADEKLDMTEAKAGAAADVRAGDFCGENVVLDRARL